MSAPRIRGPFSVATFSRAVTDDRKTTGRVCLDDRHRRLVRPDVEFDVVAVKVQIDRLIARPTQLDHVAFSDPDRLLPA
jgi:hypothetical protein